MREMRLTPFPGGLAEGGGQQANTTSLWKSWFEEMQFTEGSSGAWTRAPPGITRDKGREKIEGQRKGPPAALFDEGAVHDIKVPLLREFPRPPVGGRGHDAASGYGGGCNAFNKQYYVRLKYNRITVVLLQSLTLTYFASN